jgi:hypothetical protein
MARMRAKLTSSSTPRPTDPPRAPDFVGIGAQKCGTSWWYALLRQHPAVDSAPGRGKELHFFDDYFDRELSPESIERYHNSFRAPGGVLTGEWTPRYLYLPWAIPLLRRAAPHCRVMVILRDPTDRVSSGVTHHLAGGDSLSSSTVTEHIERSRYAPQLRRLFGHFPSEQVLVLQYEQLVTDAALQLRRTQDFLGLEPRAATGDLASQRINATAARRWEPPGPVRTAIRDDLHHDLDELRELCPTFDWTAWPTIG